MCTAEASRLAELLFGHGATYYVAIYLTQGGPCLIVPNKLCFAGMKVTELTCLCVVQGGVAVGDSDGAVCGKGPVIGVLFGIAGFVLEWLTSNAGQA